MKYEIGQILTANRDVEIERFSGSKEIVPKGSRIIIGADNMAHYFKDLSMQNILSPEVQGYNAYGLSEWIYSYLDRHIPMCEILEYEDIEEDDFKNYIAEALEEIGFISEED